MNKVNRLIELFNKIESSKNQDDILFHAETTLRAQEALKEDYGLGGMTEENTEAQYAVQ